MQIDYPLFLSMAAFPGQVPVSSIDIPRHGGTVLIRCQLFFNFLNNWQNNMFENEAAVCRYAIGYLEKIVKDFSDSQWDQVAAPGLHSPRWIASHIAIAGDMGLVLVGLPKMCPAAWHAAYGPRSSGTSHEKIRPERDELLELIPRIYGQLAEQAARMPLDFLNQPHSLELLKGTELKTNAHLIVHLMSTHLAVHVGQLTSIRRLWGHPFLF
jgi:hypothetical protein